ncbi:hypothetical protein [Enterococcus faecium]|uniref:hypothetical protein n=1 Tax=Enterococcus faecium TaxID=1352 RepID=UPI0021A67625|nr:hypothetical protein [Enterococcus faecium]
MRLLSDLSIARIPLDVNLSSVRAFNKSEVAVWMASASQSLGIGFTPLDISFHVCQLLASA